MNATATIFVYAENCVMAGQSVPVRFIEERSPEVSDDWVEVELTEDEAAYYAERRGQYGRKVAATIREAMRSC